MSGLKPRLTVRAAFENNGNSNDGSRSSAALRNDSQKSKGKRRFPSGMTNKKGRNEEKGKNEEKGSNEKEGRNKKRRSKEGSRMG
jgi:hypothetical protein